MKKKMLPAVIQNIYAVGRQAQVTEGYDGPRLGVRYTVTAERKEERRKTKEAEAMKMYKEAKNRESMQISRRDELESIKKEEARKHRQEVNKRARSRRLTRGDLQEAIETEPIGVSISISPVVYGMDLEAKNKMKQKYNVEEEEVAMDWIELVTGKPIDKLHQSLKSGVILCELINKIRPGSVPKINSRAVPLLERENIQMFLNSSVSLGIPNSDLFVVSDLYEHKNLGAVVNTVGALGRMAAYKNPSLVKYGTRVVDVTQEVLTEIMIPKPVDFSVPVPAPVSLVPPDKKTPLNSKKDERCCSTCNIL